MKPRDVAADELPQMRALADAIGDVLDGWQATRHALWLREAELAVGVPLVTRSDEDAHLAERLQAILQGAAEAVDAHAAALYLLDDATSQLKLRAAWGLPPDRFVSPARPLRGALADLEALTGHAVVLEDTHLLPHWKTPENFAAAVCVPVSSPTTPLGTLWVFGREVREFSEQQTNMIEIVAGRLASDLEREILLSAAEENRALRRDLESLAERRDDEDPLSHVLSDAWQLAARSHRGRETGGDFVDWHVSDDDTLALALGSAHGQGLARTTTASLVQGAVKSALLVGMPPKKLMQHIASVLWTTSTGDQGASLIAFQLHPREGQVNYCSAGPLGAIVVRASRPSSISQGSAPLGCDADAAYHCATQQLALGDALVVVSDAVRKAVNSASEQLGEAAIADAVQQQLSATAEEIATAIYELWHHHTDDPRREVTIVVAKRMA
jgi:serine phosphatase RsbU (regulator of sigma subunit)